jgi:hypothetical protein
MAGASLQSASASSPATFAPSWSAAAARGINPAEYLADIFARLPGMKPSELSQIIPARWQKQPA